MYTFCDTIHENVCTSIRDKNKRKIYGLLTMYLYDLFLTLIPKSDSLSI